jgi:hypothetical protein
MSHALALDKLDRYRAEAESHRVARSGEQATRRNRILRIVAMAVLVGLAGSACSAVVVTGTSGDTDDAQVDVKGSGQVVEEARPVTGFTRISLHSEGQVTIVQGATEALTVETDDNLMEYLEISVESGVLDIRLRGNGDVDLEPTNGIAFNVSVVALDGIDLYGAGTFTMDGLTTDRLSLNVGGAGDIEITNLNADELDVMVEGAGSVVLSGQVAREHLTLAGTGHLDGSELSAGESIIELNGVGDIAVWAIDRMDVSIGGIGDVYYYGSPSVTRSVTGFGSVRHLGDRQHHTGVGTRLGRL